MGEKMHFPKFGFKFIWSDYGANYIYSAVQKVRFSASISTQYYFVIKSGLFELPLNEKEGGSHDNQK